MSTIVKLLPLIEVFLWLNIVLMVMGVIWIIVWLAKRGLFKYAFRKHEYWQLVDRIEELERDSLLYHNRIVELENEKTQENDKAKKL